MTGHHHAPHIPAPADRAPPPKLIAILCIVVMAGAGWLALGLMAADAARSGADAGLFDIWPNRGSFPGSFIAALCRPTFGSAASAGGAALLLAMWSAMVLAMMLPTAAPMVMTYAEIAETAARKGEQVASPVALIGGYAIVWLLFAFTGTVLQLLLIRTASLDPAVTTASGLLTGALFLGAGIYQFSALKRACLTQCQRPFPFFFANWTTNPGGVFRLGVRQGITCVGCCWAMMFLMFAVGTMNVVWMAALGIVMTIEKIGHGLRFSRAVGVVLVTIGVAVLAGSIAAHWPAHAFFLSPSFAPSGVTRV